MSNIEINDNMAKNSMLVTFEDIKPELRWQSCLSELESDYTLSIRQICKILMSNRSWVNRFIKPNVHHIYLSNGKGAKRGVNYVDLAAQYLEREMTESVWFNADEFINLIKNNISCSRQTARVPIEILISSEHLQNFLKEHITLNYINKSCKTISERMQAYKQRNEVLKKYCSPIGRKVLEDLPDKSKRRLTPAVTCALPELDLLKSLDREYRSSIFNYNELIAVHDIKDYGDTDEEIYRLLFENGLYRVELNLPDINGVMSQKVFYINDKEDFKIKNSVEYITISYADYCKFYK